MSTAADASQLIAADPPGGRVGLPRISAGRCGVVLLLLIALPCFLSLPWTLGTPSHTQDTGVRYNDQRLKASAQLQAPGQITYAAEEGGQAASFFEPLGTDELGRSVLARCLLGGAISLGVGICAALLAVFIGVGWGAVAGYIGGRTDALMMRIVDVFYGLPYLLLVVMLSVAVGGVVDHLSDGLVVLPRPATWLWGVSPVVYVLACGLGVAVMAGVASGLIWMTGPKAEKKLGRPPELLSFCLRLAAAFLIIATVFAFAWSLVLLPMLGSANGEPEGKLPGFVVSFITDYPLVINLLTLVAAIGGISWLTMARVIRGQVLSLRDQPFIEAARAQGMGVARMIRVHLLPNLVGPIVVYTTLAVPQAILQESFLSFLGIGVQEPLPSRGQLASKGIDELPALAMPGELQFNWWLIVFPCVLLGLTLISLNFMGDALRERFDPKSVRR